jgi:hypothetical protein
MKKLFLASLATFLIFPVFSQEKKEMVVSFASGWFNSPRYVNDIKKQFYNLGFDYSLGKRHILSADFLKGDHGHYDSIHSNNAVPLSIPGYEDNANTDADYYTFSVMYKYKAIARKKVSLQCGAGAGIMTQVILFPYTTITSPTTTSVDYRQASWSSLVFPLRVEVDYSFANHFKLGVLMGTYIHPDYAFLGNHTGFKLSYVIK